MQAPARLLLTHLDHKPNGAHALPQKDESNAESSSSGIKTHTDSAAKPSPGMTLATRRAQGELTDACTEARRPQYWRVDERLTHTHTWIVLLTSPGTAGMARNLLERLRQAL